MKIIGVIPSRYGSSRLPGKPLLEIGEKPMVWWVYQSASKVERFDAVYVATDDSRICEVCNSYNIPVVMTSEKHTNGTERLCEVSEKIDADIYVTIQGDEPLSNPQDINFLLDMILEDDSISCATLKTPFKNPIDVINGTTPKVVVDIYDNILLMTRSPVPYPKSSLNYTIYKPLGIYAFKKEILSIYSKLSMGPLEKIEEIELLRLIEHGYKVKIKEVNSETIAVDTYKDLERVRQIWKTRGMNCE